MKDEKKIKERLIKDLEPHIYANPDLIFVQDGTGTYTNVYASQPELLSMLREEIIGKECTYILPDYVSKKVLGAIEDLKGGTKFVEFEYQMENQPY